MRKEELNERLPIFPYASVTETDCPGCLLVGLKDRTREVLFNECGSLITSISAAELESFSRISMTARRMRRPAG